MEDNEGKLIYKRLIGGLDKATNFSDVGKSDFIDGYDIVDNSPKAYNEKGLLQPCSNTKFAYDLGEVEATRKKYRVSMDLTGLASCNLEFNKQILGLLDATANVAYPTGTNAADTLVLIQAALPDEVINTVTVSGFILIFDIEFIGLGYTDYILSVTNSLGGVYETVARVDAISVDKVGYFSPSCFTNINNDQQIFATTNTKKPQTLTAPVNTTGVGLRFLFATDPEIEDGEEVYIYPQNGGLNQVSTICTIERTTGNTFTVVGVQTTPMTASGTYVVVRYYRTLSLIGYAKKDDINNVWHYTDLLRSNKLNFRLYKQIQGALDVTSNGLLYDWTDYLNTLRRLIYSGEIIENGFLTTYNSEAIYDLDTIGLESVLQLGVNTSKVTLAVATSTGAGGRVGYTIGAKKEATYAAFVRFKTNDGAYSSYSKASNVLWLHSESIVDHKYELNSKRAIQITIEQIPFDIFDYVQVGIIEFTNDSWVGYSLPEIPINGQETIYVGDNGLNPQLYIDFNDANVLLEQIPFVFENARALLAYNNYLIAGNVNLYQQYDLNAWAQTIPLTVVRRKILIGTYADVIPAENLFIAILRGVNDYSRCSNIWTSYMPHDTYRFCIFIDWVNGMPTSTYWIDDVSFAPTDTGLTDDVCVKTGTDLEVYQYYLEAKGIDLDYVLPNGKLLRDEVKDIRFGRALVNPKVQTTGLGIAVFDNGAFPDYISGFNDGANTIVLDKLGLFSPDYQNTSQTFNWQLGDYLLATQAFEGGTITYSPNNKAFSFDRNAASDQVNTIIGALQNSETGGSNNIASLLYFNVNANLISIRRAAAVSLFTALKYDDATDGNVCQNFYYLREYGSDGAYPISPQQTRFFVIPQNNWFNAEAHDSSTVYEIYGGDAFPTPSAYKTAENTSGGDDNAAVVFYSFNRTNAALRSGRYPFYTLEEYLTRRVLTDAPYLGDNYTYENTFTPVYLFQNQVAFNALLPQYLNKFSSLYYSNQSFGTDNAGGNRIWLPLDMKTLETKYGAIVDIDVLLGQTGTNILIVLQERRLTAQYFDNTANIKSNTGELLIGNGKILERDGQNFTEFGCEHKWTAIKGQTATGKDLKYWLCLRKTAIMRFGADGTSNIIGNIAPLIENKAILGLFNGYNEDDAPAFFNGCHAVWDNKRMEYILTLRLMPKTIAWTEQFAQKGDFKADPELKWGFEQFPVIYKSLKDTNDDPVTDPTAWTTYEGYDSGYFEILTIVWNEENNVFKTYRTYSPKIYGQFNDNYVSSHPTQGNLIFEHNDILSEAIYYSVETTTAVTATTDPTLFRITGTGIESTFPSPFAPYERQKYIVTINGKNYEVVGTGTDYLEMANVDTDDVLPQVTIENFSYSVVNCQDPYIEGVANETKPMFVEYGLTTVQSNSQLKGMRFIAGLNSLSNQTVESNVGKARDEDYYQGTTNQQIPSPETPARSMLQGYWMKFKSIWRWGKSNKVEGIIINYTNVDKKI